MGELVVYDKAKYYMAGDSHSAPSWEHASAVPLFMIRWCMDRDLLSPEFKENAAASLSQFQNGAISLFEFYEKECDLVFACDMLSDEGNAFVAGYYDYAKGAFVNDIWPVLGISGKEYPLYTDANYLRVKPVIDSRYAEWKSGGIKQLEGRKKKLPPWLKKTIGILIVAAMFVFVFVFIWVLKYFIHP